MEKIKEIFGLAVEYCKNEPFHAIMLAAFAALVLIVLIVMIAVSAKKSKAKKTAAKATKKETIESKTATEIKPECKTECKAEEQVQEEKEETPIPPSPAPAKTKEPAPVPTKESIPANESAPAPSVKVKKEESVKAKTEKKEEATEKKPTKKAAEKTEEKPVAEKPAVEKKAENKSAKKSKEGTMLHDEFKDVDTDLDFYEEDESDITARYSGKWVICRVVTDDNASDEMYFFELHASNGEKLLSSEEYTTYNGAIRGIETHKINILKGNFRITLSKKGDYIFKLLNGKNMLLCMGEHYATRARCESAIESTKRFARTAFIDENLQDHVVKLPPEDDSPIEPVHENYNGKWVIDCKTSPEGEKVFYFELFANNGERLLSSEEYTTYIGAVNGIQTHKMNIVNGNFRISLTKHGDYIYKLLNGNGQLLCLGEHYKTKRRCQNAVESVKRFAMNSPTLTDPNLTK